MIPMLNDYIVKHQMQPKNTKDGRYQYYRIPYPILRDMSKKMIKNEGLIYFDQVNPSIYEHLILYTMVLRGVKDIKLGLTLFDQFYPYAKDWSTVDSLCQNFIITKTHQEIVWNHIQPMIGVDDEFVQRIVSVMILTYFINDYYIDQLFPILNQLTHPGYYTKMGVAWAIATIASTYPNQTIAFLKKNTLDPWTHNKAIQKARESFRVDDEVKMKLLSLKR